MAERKNAMRRVGVYLEEELLEWCDSLLAKADARSRNEFIKEAIRFYCGYLTSRQAANYLLQALR